MLYDIWLCVLFTLLFAGTCFLVYGFAIMCFLVCGWSFLLYRRVKHMICGLTPKELKALEVKRIQEEKERWVQEEMKNKGITMENLLERIGFTPKEIRMFFDKDDDGIGEGFGWSIFKSWDDELKREARRFLLLSTSSSIDEFMERQALRVADSMLWSYRDYSVVRRINFLLPPRLYSALKHFCDNGRLCYDGYCGQTTRKFIDHLRNQKEV